MLTLPCFFFFCYFFLLHFLCLFAVTFLSMTFFCDFLPMALFRHYFVPVTFSCNICACDIFACDFFYLDSFIEIRYQQLSTKIIYEFYGILFLQFGSIFSRRSRSILIYFFNYITLLVICRYKSFKKLTKTD